MKRFLIPFVAVLLATIVGGRIWAYRQLLAQRRHQEEQRQRVDQALAQRISTADFAGEDQNVYLLMREIAGRSAVPLMINTGEFRRRGLAPQRKITMPLGVFTLEELLDRVTDNNRMRWCRWDDRLVITSLTEGEQRNAPYSRVYRLPTEFEGGAPISDDAGELGDLISTTIEPDTWDDVGGPGVLRDAGGAVVVHETPEVQRKVAVLLSNIAAAQRGQISPLETWPAEIDRDIHAALSRVDSIELVDEPLAKFAQVLGQRHNITIVLATRILAEAGITPDTPITKKLTNVSLRTILRETLGDLKLTYSVRDGVVQITTPEDAESYLVHWMFDAADLVDPQRPHDFKPLMELIMTTVEPDSWDEVGGPGCISSFGGRWLVVSQTEPIRHKVEQLLGKLRSVLRPGGIDEVRISPAVGDESTTQQALNRQMKLSFRDVSLKDVCRQLSEEIGVPILLRRSQLAEAAIYEDEPITIDLPMLELGQGLRIMLRDEKLAYFTDDDVIYVTVPEYVENNLDTRVLDVRHLTAPGAGGINERTLERLIRTVIHPDTWEEVGGPGWMSYYAGLLGVTQTDEIQQEVRHLIDVLCEHLLEPPGENSPQSLWVGRSSGEEQMLARLQKRDSLEVKNADIHETVQEQCARHSIPVVFRQSYIERAIGGPRTATLSVTDAPLYEILSKLLAEKGGGIATWNGVLFVTDEETAEREPRVRLYRVGQRWPGEKRLSDRELAKLLVERVEPDSWAEAGGPGFTMPLNGQWLLVGQPLAIHRKIEEAIEKLKAGEELPVPQVEATEAARQAIAPASE